MATAIVSGRIDASVKERAGAYIKAAGLTPADVIKRVWDSIASTGYIPDEKAPWAHEQTEDPLEHFIEICDQLSAELSEADREWLSALDSDGIREAVTEGLIEKYA